MPLAILAVLAGVAHADGTGRVIGKVSITDADGKAASAETIIYVVCCLSKWKLVDCSP